MSFPFGRESNLTPTFPAVFPGSVVVFLFGAGFSFRVLFTLPFPFLSPFRLTQPPCADYSRLLVMRKSCKMYTGWASSWVLLSKPLRLQYTLRHLRRDWVVGTVRWASLECADCAVLLVSYGAGRLSWCKILLSVGRAGILSFPSLLTYAPHWYW